MTRTGIIRRVDDLGRIVIPKEIRRLLGVVEGDAMEVIATDGGVLFKKYTAVDGITDAVIGLKNYVADEEFKSRDEVLQKIMEIQDILKAEQLAE